MVKPTVLYGPPADSAAFERDFAETHLPLGAQLPSTLRAETAKVVGPPGGSPPPVHRIFALWFETPERMQASVPSRSPLGGDSHR